MFSYHIVTVMCQDYHKAAANTCKMNKPCGSLLLSTAFLLNTLLFLWLSHR